MSDHFRIARLISESDLTATQRHVLLVVSAYASGTEGYCSATASTLSRDTGLSRRTIQTALAELRASGWLSWDDKLGGPVKRRITVGVCNSCTPGEGGCAAAAQGGVQLLHRGCATAAHDPLADPPEPDPRLLYKQNDHTYVSADDDVHAVVCRTTDTDPGALLTEAGRRRLIKALETYTPDQLVLVWEFFTTAQQPQAVLARQGGWAYRWRSLANHNLESRVALAEQWAALGRPAPRKL